MENIACQLENIDVILLIRTFLNFFLEDHLKNHREISYLCDKSFPDFRFPKRCFLYLKKNFLYSIFTLFAICELINKVNFT